MALPKSILLIISGSVAAYKSLELVRLLKSQGVHVTGILTRGGAQFITPLVVSSLTGNRTYTDLFSLTDEVEMGHIELSRSAELILVAPASADIMAKMAAGICDDLATTALLATDKPVVIAPAMNHRMWHHAATQQNIATLRARGITIIDPTEGDMACGEFGIGRMAEPVDIVTALSTCHPREGGTRQRDGVNPALKNNTAADAASDWIPAFAGMTSLKTSLKGRRAIVTSGSTQEPIDPVRFVGNYSSGKQGHAIAAALAAAGADVTLICGATSIPAPANVRLVSALTAEAMRDAIHAHLPADIFVGAAAVADWRVTHVASHKIKKHKTMPKMTLDFIPTVDVLAGVATHKNRPALVVGFAAESEHLAENARAKRQSKNCDWIVANDISNHVFGSDENEVLLITEHGETAFPRMRKDAVAVKLVEAIVNYFEPTNLSFPRRRESSPKK